MWGLLATLAVVVALDVVLLLAADRRPVATVVTREPIGTGSRSSSPPRGAGPSAASQAPGTTAPAITCATPPPSPSWSCQNGVWMMVPTTSTAGNASSTTGASTTGAGAGNCLGVQPGAGWTCRGGAWIPPAEMPTATAAAGTAIPPVPPIETSSQPPVQPAQPSCIAPNPAAGMPGVTARCVNGTWVIGGI